eukprot:CAMPEP_0206164498 /NCGR_PEP_ID=MMETSP1474-20131121/16623_1 /ASSEMBLY_ACC=CAM_ASM_001110 /TAXON_ID=97495 /ORGANISM="Imantonia sp., Strain RCC918" /LENGTH=189 /DNA_ID=CAMNT_0053567397 /DNA_START=95 /DNA_END=661 /DNA_ORIENTATION=+
MVMCTVRRSHLQEAVYEPTSVGRLVPVGFVRRTFCVRLGTMLTRDARGVGDVSWGVGGAIAQASEVREPDMKATMKSGRQVIGVQRVDVGGGARGVEAVFQLERAPLRPAHGGRERSGRVEHPGVEFVQAVAATEREAQPVSVRQQVAVANQGSHVSEDTVDLDRAPQLVDGDERLVEERRESHAAKED